MIWLIYTQVLIYAPGFIYCQIYLQLNLKILQIYNKRNISYAIVILHILAQIVLIYLLVFLLNYGVQGIIFSITISSFFSYFFSNMIINEMHVIENNFYFYNLENVIIENDTIKNYLFAGLFSYFEYAGFAFFVIFSYFISDEAQAANIILLNFLSFLHIFGKGLAQTLKNYIQLSMSRYKHSHIGKKKFVKFLSIVTFFIALTFSIIILTFDKTIVRIYLSAPLPQEILDISKMFSHIVNFFAIVIFFDYLSKVLDGYVKGIDAATTYLMIYKISFLVVFIPIALVLCFKLKLGLIGFWMIIYFYVILYTLINAFYVYKYYSIWFK
jgi:hypothetical protein